jgi:hypothetical protein
VRAYPALLTVAIFGISLISCSRATETAKAESPADKWKESQSRSAMDDTVTYMLGLAAEGSVPVRPKLVIACSAGNLRVYMDSQTLLSQDSEFTDLGWYTVGRYRFDQEEAQRISWETSTDHHAIFVPKITVDGSGMHHQYVLEFVDRIASAQILHFEYNPLNGGPTVAEFDLRGFGDHLNHLKTQCPL